MASIRDRYLRIAITCHWFISRTRRAEESLKIIEAWISKPLVFGSSRSTSWNLMQRCLYVHYFMVFMAHGGYHSENSAVRSGAA
jgi:hypothetical protein